MNLKYMKFLVVYRGYMGENVVEYFFDSLLWEEEYIKGIFLDNEFFLMIKELEIKFWNLI